MSAKSRDGICSHFLTHLHGIQFLQLFCSLKLFQLMFRGSVKQGCAVSEPQSGEEDSGMGSLESQQRVSKRPYLYCPGFFCLLLPCTCLEALPVPPVSPSHLWSSAAGRNRRQGKEGCTERQKQKDPLCSDPSCSHQLLWVSCPVPTGHQRPGYEKFPPVG